MSSIYNSLYLSIFMITFPLWKYDHHNIIIHMNVLPNPKAKTIILPAIFSIIINKYIKNRVYKCFDFYDTL